MNKPRPKPKGARVLIIGSGGREHAIAWKLKQSRKVDRLICAPGNGGIAKIARCVDINPVKTRNLADLAVKNRIDLAVVGPEVALEAGIVDEFQKHHIKIFGPNKNAARLESSKVYAKEFMRKYHIPTAPYKKFSSSGAAIGFCKSVEYPVVIKADGLAAGKGVFVVDNFDEASDTITKVMETKTLGDAGKKIIVESFLRGQEVSIMAFCDGKTIIPMLPSQDHKQAYEGDKGPNTGGMGAYCPTSFVTPEIMERIEAHVLNPFLKGLEKEGLIFRGVIYAGIMLTSSGLKVLEFNCRFGDPETQVVLPLLRTDFFDILLATATGKLQSIGKLSWREQTSACVVMASKGYPGKYSTGLTIRGLDIKLGNGNYIFHAGTGRKSNNWVTAGGRVLNVVGIESNLKLSLDKAYRMVKNIKFDGAMYRKDIGFRSLQA
ncbi:MAG: phosphoribosylamine--glycine ligase [candidate division Zixibacteria bacterium]|nr:phosphoribosylamine--glycine ligase [candidate division Zixibacteria bacterium]